MLQMNRLVLERLSCFLQILNQETLNQYVPRVLIILSFINHAYVQAMTTMMEFFAKLVIHLAMAVLELYHQIAKLALKAICLMALIASCANQDNSSI